MLSEETGEKDNITCIVQELSQKGIFPKLSGKRLFDVSNSNEDIESFVRNNSFLEDSDDIKQILMSAESNNDYGKLYKIIFSENKKENYKVGIFSGGTGSKNLIRGLIEKGLNLKTIINAYDDGKSTGDIRRKLGTLGPSDIAKNMISLMKDNNRELKKFLSYRFSVSNEGKKILKTLIQERTSQKLELLNLFKNLKPEIKIELKKFLKTFLDRMNLWEKENGTEYLLTDYGMRNIVYIGAYFYFQKDYHYTNKKLARLFDLAGEVVLNSQENLWLLGMTNEGILLNSEEEIVGDHLESEIARIFLSKRLLSPNDIRKFYSSGNLDDRINYLEENFSLVPRATKESLDTLKQSDLLLFAPTTFYSSLAPTLITEGISEGLHNSSALKILVLNLIRERGKKTAIEIFDELQEYLNYKKEGTHEVDYIIINNHGNRTDGVFESNRIPIDRKNFFNKGVETIEVCVEDESLQNHNPQILSDIILSLKKLDELGYCIFNKKITKKDARASLEKNKSELKSLLKNPLSFNSHKEAVYEKIKVLGKTRKDTRVIMMIGGKASRLKSSIPKTLYPILGKANLEYLLDKYNEIDSNPILVVNPKIRKAIEKWLEENPKYKAEIFEDKIMKGTAAATLEVINKKLRNFDGNILLSWGDITNVREETLNLILSVHNILEPCMTLPTSWEKEPYAGLLRDGMGNVRRIFTREDKVAFGEHDGSIFIFDKAKMQKALNIMLNGNSKENKNNSGNFLHAINISLLQGEEVIGVCCMDEEESFGFNTIEESLIVEENLKSMWRNKRFSDRESQKISEQMTHSNKRRMEDYLNRNYKGLLIDMDETLTEQGKNDVSPEDIEILISLAKKIPIGITTGRTNKSLKSKLIDQILSSRNFDDILKKRFYIYPEGGAYGYRLDKGENQKLYSKPIPAYVSEASMKLIRNEVLGLKDDYSIQDHKIHIWPKKPFEQRSYVDSINEIFHRKNLPLLAYRSNSEKSTGSIIISHIQVNKRNSLMNFAHENSLGINEIVKIGDMADIKSVDHPMMLGKGSFSVGEHDIFSTYQVSIPTALGEEYSHIRGTRWLLRNLNLNNL